jgi:hypothetical protein
LFGCFRSSGQRGRWNWPGCFDDCFSTRVGCRIVSLMHGQCLLTLANSVPRLLYIIAGVPTGGRLSMPPLVHSSTLWKLRSFARRGLSVSSSDQSSLMRSAGRNTKSNNANHDGVCCRCAYLRRLRYGGIPLRAGGAHVRCCRFIGRCVAVRGDLGIDHVAHVPTLIRYSPAAAWCRGPAYSGELERGSHHRWPRLRRRNQSRDEGPQGFP